jgi:hypothetical protein
MLGLTSVTSCTGFTIRSSADAQVLYISPTVRKALTSASVSRMLKEVSSCYTTSIVSRSS